MSPDKVSWISSLNQARAEHLVKGGPGRRWETRKKGVLDTTQCQTNQFYPPNMDETRQSMTSDTGVQEQPCVVIALSLLRIVEGSQFSLDQRTQTVTEFVIKDLKEIPVLLMNIYVLLFT